MTAGSTQTGSYDEQDRVTSYGGYTFTYTANGEIESKTGPAGTTTYRYDPFGNLAGVTLPSGTVVDYILDGRHRRVAKKVNGTVTQKFLYADGLRPIAQLAADDSLVYQFLYAERSNAPSLIIGPSGTYRVVSNHLGSPRAIIDIATGASLRSSYDEFGNVTSDTNPAFQPFAFAGGLYDSDTHLVHFGAREYDATLGRFTSRDPLGFGGGQANVYDYAANDPINFVDPSGLLHLPGGNVDAGEGLGQTAVGDYADWLTDPNSPTWLKIASAIGGTFAALWTPCTSDKTFMVLVTAATLGAGSAEVAAEEATEIAATGPINVIGRLKDTEVAADWAGYEVFNPAEWCATTNDAWVAKGIEEGRAFYLASEPSAANLSNAEYLTGFGREVGILDNAGYTRAGDYLIPAPR